MKKQLCWLVPPMLCAAAMLGGVICYSTVEDTTCKKLGTTQVFGCAWLEIIDAAWGFKRCDETPTGKAKCKDVGDAKQCWYKYVWHECNGYQTILCGTNNVPDKIADGGDCPS